MSTITHSMVSKSGSSLGDVELPVTVFNVKVPTSLVHEVVRWQRAKARAGTHSALNKKAMTGGGKKPYRQKGTGNARAGSPNSPVWVGGAVAHGPTPRDYTFGVPKKVRRKALAGVLTHIRRKGKLIIVDDISVESGKTRELAQYVATLSPNDDRVAIVSSDSAGESLFWRAASNIKGLIPHRAHSVNVYDLLRSQYVIIEKGAIEQLESRILGTKSKEKGEAIAA